MEKLQAYFNNNREISDFEFSLAVDLSLIKSNQKTSLSVQQFLNTEKVLSKGYIIIQLRKHQKDINCDDLHSIYQLNQKTVSEWISILAREDPKKRTLVFYGKSNSGKSQLANALLYPFNIGRIQRDGGTNVHWLENIHLKSFILWEEPTIHLTNIEDVKLLLGGENLVINRKNKNLIDRPTGAAVIITCNKAFWNYEREPLLNRINIYQFTNTSFKRFISIQETITYLCQVYDGRYN